MEVGCWKVTSKNHFVIGWLHSDFPSWIEDVFPIKHGDIPASYVSLPEGNISTPKIHLKMMFLFPR